MNETQPAWKRSPDTSPRAVTPAQVWLCPAAVVAEIAVDGDLGAGHRESLARLLRVVGDAAAQVGHPAPVLGLIRPLRVDPPRETDTDNWRNSQEPTAEAWNADQDWNRGDFIIEVVASEEDARQRVESLAHPLSPTILGAAPIGGTRTLDDLTRNLDELANRQMDKETNSLLRQVAEGLRLDDLDERLKRWADERIEAASQAAARVKEQAEEKEPEPTEGAEIEVSGD